VRNRVAIREGDDADSPIRVYLLPPACLRRRANLAYWKFASLRVRLSGLPEYWLYLCLFQLVRGARSMALIGRLFFRAEVARFSIC
jgi:hypothetical protein